MDIKNEVKRIAKENNLTSDEVVRLFLLEFRMGENKDRIVYNRKTGRFHYTHDYEELRHHY